MAVTYNEYLKHHFSNENSYILQLCKLCFGYFVKFRSAKRIDRLITHFCPISFYIRYLKRAIYYLKRRNELILLVAGGESSLEDDSTVKEHERWSGSISNRDSTSDLSSSSSDQNRLKGAILTDIVLRFLPRNISATGND